MFGEELVLSHKMVSEGVAPQRYHLHGVVHHHGSGPNSGHYIASVRGMNSAGWYEMNDSSVHPHHSAPINARDAYLLFYVRAPSNTLHGVLHNNAHSPSAAAVKKGTKRRLVEEGEEADAVRPVSESTSPSKKQAHSPVHYTQKKDNRPLFRNFPGRSGGVGTGAEDDDDVGEAMHGAVETSSGYETLSGPQDRAATSTNSSTSAAAHHARPAYEPTRPHKAKHGAPHAPSRGMNSLVVSPYLAGQKHAGTEPMRVRMKDKHGHRDTHIR